MSRALRGIVKRLAAVLVACAACRAREPVRSCGDVLSGEWQGSDGRTWALLEGSGGSVEGYPTFADPVVPRALALVRDERGGLGGTVSRRWERAGRQCATRAPVHVVACADDELTLVWGEPPEPVFAPGGGDECLSATAATHRERWHRIR